MHTLLEDEAGARRSRRVAPALEQDFDLGELEAVELPSSAEALDLFLTEIGRHPLLTAAEEVVSAKAVERAIRLRRSA